MRTLIACLLLVLLSGCGPMAESVPQAEGDATPSVLPAVLSYNFGTDPLVLDPLYATDRASLDLVTQLFDGLTSLDPETAQPQPALAEEWDVSSDGQTYTFRLRSGVTWVNQDGEPQGELTADDVVYAIQRGCQPGTEIPAQALLYIIQECERISTVEGIPDLESVGVRAVERYIVEFQLVAPAAYFPTILAMPTTYPVPADILQQQGAAWSEWPTILTNGPFYIESWEEGGPLHLLKNERYYRASENSLARIEGARLAPGDAVAAYREGELDAMRVPSALLSVIGEDGALRGQLRSVPDQCLVSYGITLVNSPVDATRVRGALTAAIDREQLAQQVSEGAVPARHLAPASAFGTPGERVAVVTDDIARAQALLASAGYPEGAGVPPISLSVPDTGQDKAVAEAIVQMWRENLNVAVDIVPTPVEQYNRSIARTVPPSEMAHLWLLRWCGALPDEHAWSASILALPEEFASDLFPSDSRNTIPARANPLRRVYGDIDLLIEEAMVESDPETRQQLYTEVETLALVEEVYLIPLYHTTSTWLNQPWVSSVAQNEAGPILEQWQIDMSAKE